MCDSLGVNGWEISGKGAEAYSLGARGLPNVQGQRENAAHFTAAINDCQRLPVKMVNSFSNGYWETAESKGREW